MHRALETVGVLPESLRTFIEHFIYWKSVTYQLAGRERSERVSSSKLELPTVSTVPVSRHCSDDSIIRIAMNDEGAMIRNSNSIQSLKIPKFNSDPPINFIRTIIEQAPTEINVFEIRSVEIVWVRTVRCFALQLITLGSLDLSVYLPVIQALFTIQCILYSHCITRSMPRENVNTVRGR